jgi:hypothetical protein
MRQGSSAFCLRYMYMYLPNLSCEYCVLESFTASQLGVYGNFHHPITFAYM